MDATRILEKFPKTRPPLPPAIEAIYAAHYLSNRSGGTPAASLAQRMESWLHAQVAADVRGSSDPQATLEIGAGTLNQIDYEPDIGPYDVVEPFSSLYEGSPQLGRVRRIFSAIEDVPLQPVYGRITSVATFEHICELPGVVARCGLLLIPGGTLRVSIPSEGSPLWTLGWKLTTGLEFRLRYGLDYGQLMRHEHVNTADEIEAVLQHFFSDVRCKVLGLNRRWSLYRFYVCQHPRLGLCRNWPFGRRAESPVRNSKSAESPRRS